MAGIWGSSSKRQDDRIHGHPGDRSSISCHSAVRLARYCEEHVIQRRLREPCISRHQAFALAPVSERRFRVYKEAPGFRPGPPCHRMPYNSRNGGSKCVSMTRRAYQYLASRTVGGVDELRLEGRHVVVVRRGAGPHIRPDFASTAGTSFVREIKGSYPSKVLAVPGEKGNDWKALGFRINPKP